MGATYDKNDLKSVLEYIREEYGTGVFCNGAQMYAFISDFAPGLSAEGDILRRLAEKGMLSELEKAIGSCNQMEIDRARMKIRYHLTNKMFMSEEKMEFFLDVLGALYKVKVPFAPVPTFSAPLRPKPTPTPPKNAPPKPIQPQHAPPQPIPHPTPAPSQPIPQPPPASPQPTQQQPVPPPLKRHMHHRQYHTMPSLPSPVACVAFALIIMAFFGIATAKPNPKQQTAEQITWTLEKYTLTISGYTAMEDKAEDNVSPWYGKRKNVYSVVIEDGVTSIGNYAFKDCEYLTSITIPNSVVSIGTHAFMGCVNLTHIDIPDSVTNIGGSAFAHCKSLQNIVIPDGVTIVGNFTFCACDSLTSVVIPDSVTEIGFWAFDDCDNLTSVSIPTNAKIELYAFPKWTTVTRRE